LSREPRVAQSIERMLLQPTHDLTLYRAARQRFEHVTPASDTTRSFTDVMSPTNAGVERSTGSRFS